MAMPSVTPLVDTRRRIILFGGQGSRSLFSPASLSAVEEDLTTSPAASILLSKCHVAFLEEISSLSKEEKQILGLDLHLFGHARSLLSIQGDYQEHAVLQATTLCLHQLLHYLGEAERAGTTFESYFNDILETTGFCAGLVSAVVVASSRNIGQYLTFGVAAFRLAFWIGYRTMIRSLKSSGKESLDATWSLIISGLDQAKVEDTISGVHAHSASQTLRISGLSCPNVISVSGSPHDLLILRNLLGPKTTFAHVHAWYHGGEQLEEVVSQIEHDIANRNIHFPSASDILKPLRSTLDAKIFDANSPANRLDIWVTRHLLVHCVHWNAVFPAVLQAAYQVLQDDKDSFVEIDSFGPSSQFLLAGAKSHSDHPRLQVQDLSSFTSLGKNSDRGVGNEGIAIVGMGVNLPRGNGLEELWQTLSNGLSAIQEIPESRFNLSDHYTTDDASKSRSMHAKHGAFLDDIWTFDNTFFSISPREAMSMDPQQRILMHTAQAALDDAGYVQDSTPSFQRASMGCYIGLATGDYTENLRDEIDAFYSPGNRPLLEVYGSGSNNIAPGTLRAFHSGRLSYVHKFSGPCMTIDTACSSSLVAIYQACRALQHGDCTSALAGGVNAICGPDMYIGLDKGHFLSSTGGCKSFDVSADGYSRAEGSVVFVLKRLSDAITENDRIHGVIKDVVVNQSGNARSITHPHSETQVMLYKNLLHRTGVQPSSISVVEAHGTGTQAGDTREVASLETVFGKYHSEGHPLMVSSIKGNIGHCEAASGAAGLAKLLLMLRNGIMPKQASLTDLNPRITELEEGHLKIPKENQPWPATKYIPRRAMLNNFGAAGSNAALLLEEHKEIQSDERDNKSRSAYPFCISAKTQDALHECIKAHQDFFSRKGNLRLEDICYAATARRPLYNWRFSAPCSSMDELRAKLNQFDASKVAQATVRGIVIFIFSGQGSMYAGMGKELMQTSALFKEQILLCDHIVRSVGCPGILDYFDDNVTAPLGDMEEVIASQCACVALEYGLGMLLMSWNIIPSYTLGHSLGEFAAMTISGALSIQDTMRIVAARAKLMATHCTPKASGMTVCKLHSIEADAMLEETKLFSGLRVACRNSKTDCVVSGPLDHLRNFEEACVDKNIKAKRLEVPYGFHSASMDPILPPLKDLGSTVNWSKPSIPIFSTVFGRLLSSDKDFESDYFALHASRPVLFEDCIQNLDSQGILDDALCLEVGPHPICLPMVRSTVMSEACRSIPTLSKGTPAWESLSAALCQMVSLTDNIHWRSFFASSDARMTDLPGYPLNGKIFKVPYREGRRATDDIGLHSSASHTQTGLRFLPKMIPSVNGHLFETTTDLLAPLISGHNVGGTAICPASVFFDLALEGARAIIDMSPAEVLVATDMRFANPFIYVPSDKPKRVLVHLSDKTPHDSVEFRVTIMGDQGLEESVCCSGGVIIKDASDLKTRWIRDAALVRRQSDYLSRNEYNRTSRFQKRVLYDVVFTRVVKYSKEYQSLSELSISETSLEGIGTFKVPNVSEASYQPDVFVRWCDVLLHSAGCIANMTIGQEEIGICAHVESIEVLYNDIDFNNTFKVYCSLVDAVKGAIIADAFAVNPQGEVVGIIRGMEFKRLRLSTFQHMLRPSVPSINAIKPSHSAVKALGPSTSLSGTPATPASIAEASERNVKHTLTRILCDISGSQDHDLDYNSSLDALGIDSMMQIEMTTKLRQAYPGNDLDPNALSICKDLHALEATVCSMVVNTNGTKSSGDATISPEKFGSASHVSGTSSPWSSVSDSVVSAGSQINSIAIHTSSNGYTPLFLFHDGSGMVGQYSRIRDFDRNLHAFFDPHSFSPKAYFTSVSDMAAQYISHLSRTETPSLIVGGWSFGGIVAYEAAHQLIKLGFTVKGLILIDSPLPINHQPLPEPIITRFVKNTALIDEFTQNASLLARYKPPANVNLGSDFKLVILRCQDTIDTERLCNVKYDWLSRQEARDESVERWMELLRVRAKVLDIRGNHFEPFAQENVTDTSAQLRKACQYIDEV